MNADELRQYVTRVVDGFPPLTPEQRFDLGRLLRSAGSPPADARRAA